MRRFTLAALRPGTPAKTTLFAGRPRWLRASPLRKFPGARSRREFSPI